MISEMAMFQQLSPVAVPDNVRKETISLRSPQVKEGVQDNERI
jgi:hypothetical protein